MGHYDFKKVDEFIKWCEITAGNNVNDEAFKLISFEINRCSDRYINDFIGGLNFIQNEKTLNWIEENASRIQRVSQSWGHLAASSKFSWERAEKWLSKGRPLSLIALDGLMFCTTKGDRENQSIWMQELNPRLMDNPDSEVVANRLLQYLRIDRVPRVVSLVNSVIGNISKRE